MNRLKELRENRGMKQSELGKLLNVRDSAISKYEAGKIPLTADTIIKLSEIFSVTADYLLGLTDRRNLDEDSEWRYPPVSNRLGNILGDYRRKNNLSEIDFSKKLNISVELYSGIEFGKYAPTFELLKKLAAETKYDIDYLTGATDHTSIPSGETFKFGDQEIPVFYSESDYHFKARFEELCINNSINQSNAQKRLGLRKQDFTDIQYNRMPTLSELLKISYVFGVSLDYLIGKTDTRLSSLSSDELELVLNYRDCLPRYKENISKRTERLCIESLREQESESVAADDLGDTGTYAPK